MVRIARPELAERVGIDTAPAETGALNQEVEAPVRVEFDPARLDRISPRVRGVVRSVSVSLGETVRAGQPLLTLDSATAASTRAELLASQTRLTNAETALRRTRIVREAGVGTLRDIETAENEVSAARANLAALRAANAVAGGGGGRSVLVLAPRGGVVVRQAASIGQQVTAEEVLVEVADLSRVWAILDVSSADAPQLALGQRTRLTIEGIATPFETTLSWLSPTVDPHTRTVQARAVLANPEGRLRINSFGTALVTVRAAEAGVVVPRDALQRVGESDVVFVARSTSAYEARVVVVAQRTTRLAQLATGVSVGERVVTTGSFELKTELLRDSIGAGCCDGEG